jgi:hypothetical protein
MLPEPQAMSHSHQAIDPRKFNERALFQARNDERDRERPAESSYRDSNMYFRPVRPPHRA